MRDSVYFILINSSLGIEQYKNFSEISSLQMA